MQVVLAVGVGSAAKIAGLVILAAVVVACTRPKGGSPEAVRAWAALQQGALLVDVRSEAEFAGGHLDGAINVPHDRVGKRLSEFGADKRRTIVVYCRSGHRAGLAKAALEQAGYQDVINGGGIGQMQAAKPAATARGP